MIPLWIAVRLPTTANQSIMISNQLISMPKTVNEPYPTAIMTSRMIGNNVDSTTLGKVRLEA